MPRSLVEDVWPLSPLQEGLLFHAALDDRGGPDVYTVQAVLALDGPVDAARLRASWEALVARHAALRAGFRHVSGLSAIDGLKGTGLESTNDNSGRWTLPFTVGVRVRF